MNPDRWQRVKEEFHAALEREPEERNASLDRVCAGDEALRGEIERLLAAHLDAGGFIEASPVAGLAHTPAPVTTRLSGRVLDHYEVGRLIGAGGMGEVYAAHDTELGRAVALKVVTGGGTSEAQRALRREAQRASQLNHPNICTIHEVGAVGGQAYIVMEYVEGCPLVDLIGIDGLPLETLLRYGIHIADALAHAHGQGVIHRDLKSANVVVTPEGRTKVLDFGLAHAAESPPEMSQTRGASAMEPSLAGTLSYMAPELLRGEKASTRSDIWALGVMLYEMARGQRPFGGGTSFELSAAILHAAPAALPPRIPAALQTIIRRCLAKDPHERYGQAIEVRSGLEAVQAEVSTGARQAHVQPGPVRALRSRVAAVALVALVTAAAVAGAFTWRWMSGPAGPVAVGASGRPAVAVMYFDNMARTEETAWLSKGVSNMLLTGLAQTQGLDIVSAQRLQEVVKEIGGNTLESLDPTQVPEVARRAGAGAVVVGSIFNAGRELRIDAQLEDLSNGRVLVAESVRGTDVFALVDQLAARIRDGVGFRDTGSIRGVADVSTDSLEAYRLYSLGVDAYNNVRPEDAQTLLEKAVAIDQAFAGAHLHLALLSDFMGRPAARRYYLGKAAEHPDRLTARQRLLLEVEAARDAGNAAAAARLLDKLITAFPDSEEAYPIASWLYGTVGLLPDPDKHLAIAAAGVAALPTSGQTRNVHGYALLETGRHAQAVGEFETYARMAPREPNPYDSLGEAHLVMGLPERALEFYARALAVDPGFSFSRSGRAWGWAMLGRYDQAIADDPPTESVKAFVLSRAGRYREAEQVILSGSRQAEINQNPLDEGSFDLLSSLFALERGQLPRARTHLQTAEQRFAQLPEERRRLYFVLLQFLAGMVEVKAAKPAAASAHLASLRRSHNPALLAEKWWAKSLEGEIALAEGRLDDAAVAYSAGEPSVKMWINIVLPAPAILLNQSPSRDGPARVLKARGDLAGAIQAYRRLLSSGKQVNWTAMLEPRHVLELARLLEQAGEKASARQEYRRFLDIWKNADAGLPELAEARRALGRLSTIDK
jgi:TolB-like protein/Tfp pilus assembly protein PilF